MAFETRTSFQNHTLRRVRSSTIVPCWSHCTKGTTCPFTWLSHIVFIQKQRMKHLQTFSRVVVRTRNLKFSRRHLADYVKVAPSVQLSTPWRPKALLHCERFRATCLTMFWRCCGGTSCTKKFHSVTYLATATIVARQVARAVAESRIKSYFS